MLRSHGKNLMRAAAALAVAVSLAACGSSSATTSSSAPAAANGVSAADPWVKAVPDGMTAAFVTLTNSSDKEQVLVSATTTASPMVQLHEMVMQDGKMVMQEKKGGIAIPAKGTAVLEPGGNHIMLMGVTTAIKPGDSIPITLTFASGDTLEITAIGKEFTGAEESYNPSPSTSMSGM
jgi:hypothetical protein